MRSSTAMLPINAQLWQLNAKFGKAKKAGKVVGTKQQRAFLKRFLSRVRKGGVGAVDGERGPLQRCDVSRGTSRVCSFQVPAMLLYDARLRSFCHVHGDFFPDVVSLCFSFAVAAIWDAGPMSLWAKTQSSWGTRCPAMRRRCSGRVLAADWMSMG